MKYSVLQAAKKLSYTPQYIRILVQRGLLEATKEPISPGSGVLRSMITEEELDRYERETPHRNRRADGRNKYIMYATDTEFDEAVRVLKGAGRTTHKVAELIKPANLRKPNGGKHEIPHDRS